MAEAEKLKVLVCTANMGNQKPDMDSLAAWIPKDGAVEEVVVDNPKYPVRSHLTSGANKFKQAMAAFIEQKFNAENPMDKLKEFAAASASNSKSNNNKRQRDMERFDIIVIGMQESTWRSSSDHTPNHHHNNNNQLNNSSRRSSTRQNNKDSNDTTTTDNNNNNNNGGDPAAETAPLPPSPEQPTTNSHHSRVNMLGKALTRAKTVKTLTLTDVDHTKKHRTPRRSILLKELPQAESSRSPMSTESNNNNNGSRRDTHALHTMLRERLPSYTHEISYQRGEMRLLLFYADFQCDLEVLSVKAQNTGRAGLANKGGIVTEVLVNSGTRLAFLTAHLEAHEGLSKYETRCSSVGDILRGTSSSTTVCRADASLASHFTFAMGDLNFRTRLAGLTPGSVEHIDETNALVEKQDWEALNRRDELYMALRQKDCFVGFQSPICWFPPTFKVTRGPGYEYNEKRSPSYTDRILYRASDQLADKIKVLAYEPIDDFTSSDHKPIRGAFQVQLNESLKWKQTLGQRYKNMRRIVRQNARTMRVKVKKGHLIIGRSKRKSQEPADLKDKRENLHLFVSSISCHLDAMKDDYIPNCYICFMSTPKEAIQKDISKMDALRKALKINVRKQSKDEGGIIERSDAGFPRTRCIRNTYFPEWRDEEVHFKVKSHDEIGDPIDLTGAMMHIGVFDAKSNSRMIGSFTLNLAHMITETRKKNDKAPRTPTTPSNQPTGFFAAMKFLALAKSVTRAPEPEQEEPPSPRPLERLSSLNSNRGSRHRSTTMEKLGDISESCAYSDSGMSDDDDLPTNSRVSTNGPSLALRRLMDSHAPVSLSVARNQTRAALHRASSQRSVLSSTRGPTEDVLEKMNIQSLRLSEPLMKNGKQVGRIFCTIDSFWIDDETAQGERLRRNKPGLAEF